MGGRRSGEEDLGEVLVLAWNFVFGLQVEWDTEESPKFFRGDFSKTITCTSFLCANGTVVFRSGFLVAILFVSTLSPIG